MVSFDYPNSPNPLQARPPTTRGFLQVWLSAVTRPSLENYRELLNDRNVTLGWLFVVVTITTILGGLGQLYLPVLYGLEATEGVIINIAFTILCSPLISGISLVFWLLFTGGTHFIITSFLGGQGQFDQLAFLYAAYQAPMQLVFGLFSLIPFVGLCLLLPYLAYSVTLGVISINAAHNVGWVNSVAGYFAMPLAFIFLFVCCIMTFAALILVTSG
ncbi:MAG: hypothetical protein ACLFTK_14800 [Anaerolineales bacterium]